MRLAGCSGSGGRSCPIVFSNGSMDRGSLSHIDTFGCLRSLHAPVALDGVSWVQSGSVEIAIGQVDRMLQNRSERPLPPWGIAPLGSSVGLLRLMLGAYAGLNSVPCRSTACMMIARRPARAVGALLIVGRLEI